MPSSCGSCISSWRFRVQAAVDPSLALNNLNLGYGRADFMTSTTPVVKISDDGRYAQYMSC